MSKSYLFLVSILLSAFSVFSQGTETFTNIPTLTPSSYLTRTWTGDGGITWTSTDSRTDQTLNGKAIGVRNSALTSGTLANGVGTLSFSYKYLFTGSAASLTVKVNGSVVGTVAVPSSATTAQTATFSTVNTSGNSIIEIQQTVSGARVAIDDVMWTSFNAVPCADPTAQPTNLLLTATPNTVSGSFDLIPAPTEVQNYLIVRSTSSPLTVLPADGTTYTAGQVIGGGNGTVVGISTDGTFTNTVSPSTQYFYFIFAMNDQSCSGGPNYNQASPLTGNITTPALAPCTTPTVPTTLTLTPANTTIAGTFTGSGASKYLTLISTSTSLSAMPANGTVYAAGQTFGNGTVVSYSTGTTFTATGLTVATPYYLYVFAVNDGCTGEPFYSTASLNGTATTTNNTQGIPAGYYNAAAGLSCQPLKTAVKNIITSGSQVLSYTPGLWNIYQYSDQHRNDANTADIMWDMYSDNPTGPEPYTFTYGTNQCGSYSTEGNCYNREHSTPQSWFNQVSPMVSDAHHIFPTDGEVNNMRSNYPYGEVTNLISVPPAQNNPSLNGSKLGTGSASQNFGYAGTVFEPINAYKGDFARAGLYMSVRYEDEIISQNWSQFGNANQVFLSTTDEPDPAKRRLQIYDPWFLNTLVKWHNQDPVSQKEIDRNNAVYYTSVNTTSTGTPKAQSNRNPFVDHPEYVALIFQCTGVIVPVTIVNFTAQNNKENVLLKWYATFETSFKQYEIERSTDGISFNKLGVVPGRNLAEYNFTDNNLPKNPIVYYRLKMIDLDGKFKYSKIVSVRLNNNFSNAMVYPNPVVGQLNIKLDEALQSAGALQIMDVTGRIVRQRSVNTGDTNISLDVNTLSGGRYFIKIITGSQVINQSFVVIK